jgi:parallel beta-helix repeat protein
MKPKVDWKLHNSATEKYLLIFLVLITLGFVALNIGGGITGAATGTPILSGFVEANGSQCGTVNGGFTMTNNVTTTGTCFTLNASDLTIDCAGFKIQGDDGATDYGFHSNQYDNITIDNCEIVDFDYGVYIYRASHNITIINSNFTSNDEGIWVQSGGGYSPSNYNITNNTFASNDLYGIRVWGSTTTGNYIYGNYFYDTGMYNLVGIDLCNVGYGNYYDESVTYASANDIDPDDCGPTPTGTVLLNSSISADNFTWGGDGQYKTWRSVWYNTNRNFSIAPGTGPYSLSSTLLAPRSHISVSCNNEIINSTVYQTYYGVNTNNQDNVTLNSCTFTQLNYGIYILNSDNITIINSNFTDNNEGIWLGSGQNINITNNTFIGNDVMSVRVWGGATTGNYIYGNYFYDKGMYDLIGLDLCATGYGNYYDESVTYAAASDIDPDDCGPTPTGTVLLNSSISVDNFTWGGNGQYKSWRSVWYNTDSSFSIAPGTGPYSLSSTLLAPRSNIYASCNNAIINSTIYQTYYGLHTNTLDNITLDSCVFTQLDYGVYVYRSSHNITIINSNFTDNDEGIYLVSGGGAPPPSNFNITNNTFVGNDARGIRVWGALTSGNYVYGNYLYDTGMYNLANIDLCTIGYGNYYGPNVDETDTTHLDPDDCGPVPQGTIYVNTSAVLNVNWGNNATVTTVANAFQNANNTISLYPNMSYSGTLETLRDSVTLECNGATLNGSGSGNGLYINGEDYITINNCTFRDFADGVELYRSYNSTIQNSTFLYNVNYGLHVRETQDLFVSRNNFSHNKQYGIYTDGAASPKVTRVNITENFFVNNTNNAIYLLDTDTEEVYVWKNNFISNGGNNQSTSVDASNKFNTTDQGNFWSDYNDTSEDCNDVGSNGICDDPYNILGAGAVQDQLPELQVIDFDFVPDTTASNVTNLLPVNNSGYNDGTVIEIGANVTEGNAISQLLANISYPNGSTILFTLSNGTNYKTKFNMSFSVGVLNGNYNITFIANDTSDNKNNTEGTNFTVVLVDQDGDGISNSIDNLLYNETNVTTSGITKLNITVGGNSTNSSFSNSYEVLFYDQTDLIINFTHNFSSSGLDLSNVTVLKTSNSIIVNLSGQLQGNKTLYITDNSFASLCIKDEEVSSINAVSASCTGSNETDFTTCLGGFARINSINCTDLGSIIKLENLAHTAIRGTPAVVSPGGSPSSSTTSSTTTTTSRTAQAARIPTQEPAREIPVGDEIIAEIDVDLGLDTDLTADVYQRSSTTISEARVPLVKALNKRISQEKRSDGRQISRRPLTRERMVRIRLTNPTDKTLVVNPVIKKSEREISHEPEIRRQIREQITTKLLETDETAEIRTDTTTKELLTKQQITEQIEETIELEKLKDEQDIQFITKSKTNSIFNTQGGLADRSTRGKLLKTEIKTANAQLIVPPGTTMEKNLSVSLGITKHDRDIDIGLLSDNEELTTKTVQVTANNEFGCSLSLVQSLGVDAYCLMPKWDSSSSSKKNYYVEFNVGHVIEDGNLLHNIGNALLKGTMIPELFGPYPLSENQDVLFAQEIRYAILQDEPVLISLKIMDEIGIVSENLFYVDLQNNVLDELNIEVVEERATDDEIITGAFIGSESEINLSNLIITISVILIAILILLSFIFRKKKFTLNENIIINEPKEEDQ